MKKILLTLAKWFHVDITEVKYVEVEKVVEVPVVEYKERIIALEGTVEGDLTVRGNLIVEGTLTVTGGCSCLEQLPEPQPRNAKGQFIKKEG
jgi:hypothetical protein